MLAEKYCMIREQDYPLPCQGMMKLGINPRMSGGKLPLMRRSAKQHKRATPTVGEAFQNLKIRLHTAHLSQGE